MVVKKWFVLIFPILILLFAVSSMAASFPVTVSIAPLKFFVERIGGERVDVTVMVPPGASPATYEPKSRQMAALTRSKLFLAIGVPFERAWLPRMRDTNPGMDVVMVNSGIKPLYMASHHHEKVGHVVKKHEGIPDPHVWTSPASARIMARVILSALVQADPKGSSKYNENHGHLLAEIDALDSDLRRLLEDKRGTRFMVYHPAWGYFARDYGLVQMPVELEGKEPGPRELVQIIKMAKKNGIRVVFAQPQFSEKSARIVAGAIKGKVVLADPMAEDWANNLRHVGRSFHEALR
ncbi:MAG: zinc ABC transporter substrate-binding protein [Pseudodesulfovibrio sp.]|nr:zinc ABC transporter substrate-binding protein [Pseudodesulfovibrio sp.]